MQQVNHPCLQSSQMNFLILLPIGINIGAETSSEIALSIIAEIQAVSAGKLVYSLRDALHGIHAKTEMIGG